MALCGRRVSLIKIHQSSEAHSKNVSGLLLINDIDWLRAYRSFRISLHDWQRAKYLLLHLFSLPWCMFLGRSR